MKPLFVALAFALLSGSAFAQEREAPRITVSATGTASVAPDIARIDLTARRDADTAAEALAGVSETIAAVIGALDTMGVAKEDMRTSEISIVPRVTRSKLSSYDEGPRVVGYTVSSTLTVTVREIERTGAILDRAVSVGINGGGNVSYANADPDAPLERARRDAVKRATAKGRVLAEEAGVTLGRLVLLDEGGRFGGPVARNFEAARTSRVLPVAPGQQDYSVTVRMVWEIGR